MNTCERCQAQVPTTMLTMKGEHACPRCHEMSLVEDQHAQAAEAQVGASGARVVFAAFGLILAVMQLVLRLS